MIDNAIPYKSIIMRCDRMEKSAFRELASEVEIEFYKTGMEAVWVQVQKSAGEFEKESDEQVKAYFMERYGCKPSELEKRCILLKDNHIGAAGGVKEAVKMAKDYASFVRKIEIEVENLDMLKEALEAGADIIMLDNMSVEDMKEAVKLCKGKAETECSGNVTKENISKLVDIGVDYISSGALTHSAPILDLSLKNLHAI